MREISERAKGLISINFVAMIVGSSALYGKLDVSAPWIVAGRAGFCALALLAIGAATAGIVVPRRFALRLFLAGLVLAAHWTTFFESIQAAGVAIGTLAFSAFPLFTVLIDAAARRRPPRLAEIAAASIIVVAIGLLTAPGIAAPSLYGLAAGLLSGLLYAIYWHLNRPLIGALTHLQITFWQNLVASLACIPFLLAARSAPDSGLDWMFLALLGVLNTALMIIFYLYALRRLPASTCSGIIALEPIYAILFAALLFDDPVTPMILVSAGLIVGASWTLLKSAER